jgi:hypothetical protein
MRHASKRETRERDVILIRLRRRECIIYILIGFAYEYIDKNGAKVTMKGL